MGCSQVVNPSAPSLQVPQLSPGTVATCHDPTQFLSSVSNSCTVSARKWRMRINKSGSHDALHYRLPVCPIAARGQHFCSHLPPVLVCSDMSNARRQADSGGYDPEQLPVGHVLQPPDQDCVCYSHGVLAVN